MKRSNWILRNVQPSLDCLPYFQSHTEVQSTQLDSGPGSPFRHLLVSTEIFDTLGINSNQGIEPGTHNFRWLVRRIYWLFWVVWATHRMPSIERIFFFKDNSEALTTQLDCGGVQLWLYQAHATLALTLWHFSVHESIYRVDTFLLCELYFLPGIMTRWLSQYTFHRPFSNSYNWHDQLSKQSLLDLRISQAYSAYISVHL